MSTTAPNDASPRWLDEGEQQTWRRFVEVDRWLFAELDRELKAEHGLSHDDYGILVSLSEAPGDRLRMSELAELVLQSRSRLSHHVGRMEARGLVTREACPSDGRGLFAVLTPHGREVLEAAAPRHVAGVREHFVDLLPREQFDELGKALGVVVEHLRSIRTPCTEADPGCPSDGPA